VVEDVTKFLIRERRRGNTYDAIVLDPPSFGRGNKGEVWKLERDLPALLDLCSQVLSDEPLCVLLSAHTPGVTPLVLANLLADMLGNHRGLLTSMEMVIPQSDGTRVLPSGALARWSRD
jgi:23S rRNA (cytosine1962-C5)-methyltransferase